MPKVNYDTLQDALEQIKMTCERYSPDGCAACPLGDKHGICRLSISPKEWLVRHPASDAFRVLE